MKCKDQIKTKKYIFLKNKTHAAVLSFLFFFSFIFFNKKKWEKIKKEIVVIQPVLHIWKRNMILWYYDFIFATRIRNFLTIIWFLYDISSSIHVHIYFFRFFFSKLLPSSLPAHLPDHTRSLSLLCC